MPREQKPRTDLFEFGAEKALVEDAPLAVRMRPTDFGDYFGQEHLTGTDRLLRRSIDGDHVPSMILWGPPGSGKTTLAEIIAQVTQAHFVSVSAVTSGVRDLREMVDAAIERRKLYQSRTIVFIDEIHRFNKSQQDVVLPFVEEGIITLIGATTENPSFEVNAALLSRCRVYSLNALTDQAVKSVLDNALLDEVRGFGKLEIIFEKDAFAFLVSMANGDARVALNTLDFAVGSIQMQDGSYVVTQSILEDAMQKRSGVYDKNGDEHYQVISAFIKSMRSSDPDAALYWLARMLENGEEPLFIVRRMVIFAAEDVGMADPQALVVATACQQAVQFVGLPEGSLPLAETVVYLATAPKSNSTYSAYKKAVEDVRQTRNDPVPIHLRNAVTDLMREMGYGAGYKYAHDYPKGSVDQINVPDSVKDRIYYKPGESGYEGRLFENH